MLGIDWCTCKDTFETLAMLKFAFISSSYFPSKFMSFFFFLACFQVHVIHHLCYCQPPNNFLFFFLHFLNIFEFLLLQLLCCPSRFGLYVVLLDLDSPFFFMVSPSIILKKELVKKWKKISVHHQKHWHCNQLERIPYKKKWCKYQIERTPRNEDDIKGEEIKNNYQGC